MDTASRTGGFTSHPAVIPALFLAAFLAPGAYLVTTIPDAPIARSLFLLTAAVLAAAGAVGVVRTSDVCPGGAWSTLMAKLALLVPLLFAVAPLQQLVYDLYGDMPVVVWLAFLVPYLFGAMCVFDESVLRALKAVVIAAVALAVVMFVYRWTSGFVTVFGSPAYSIPAMAPWAFVALGIARASEKPLAWLVSAAVLAGALAYAGGGVLAYFTLGVGLILTLVIAPGLLFIPDRFERVARLVGTVALVAVVLAVALVMFPSIASDILPLSNPIFSEQSAGTRIHLWGAAERMFERSPWVGYGPSGYRFSAVDTYEAGVFPYIAALGVDPTSYSAPSPHSLFWGALTRLGLVGTALLVIAALMWVRAVVRRLKTTEDPSPLRRAVVVGGLTYLAALMVTPMHFASGMGGVLLLGLAIAPRTPESGYRRYRVPTLPPNVLRIALAVTAVLFTVYALWLGVGTNTASIEGVRSYDEAVDRIGAAARIIPGDPLNERRVLEVALATAPDAAALEAAQERIDAAPPYILDYAPNLPNFAATSLVRKEQLGIVDVAWERGLLDRAAEVNVNLPAIAAEQLHAALVADERVALPTFAERAIATSRSYPLLEGYLQRVDAILGE